MTDRHGKVLWATMNGDGNKPYLCVRWSKDEDITLVDLETAELIELRTSDIDMMVKNGRLEWEP